MSNVTLLCVVLQMKGFLIDVPKIENSENLGLLVYKSYKNSPSCSVPKNPITREN